MDPKIRKKQVGIHKFLEKGEIVGGLGIPITPKKSKIKKIEELFWVPVKYEYSHGVDVEPYKFICEGTIEVKYSATYVNWERTSKNPLITNIDFELNEKKLNYPQAIEKKLLPEEVVKSFVEYLPEYVLNNIPDTRSYLHELKSKSKHS
jgi:hypothetical protein